jgi:hypothetical protein
MMELDGIGLRILSLCFILTVIPACSQSIRCAQFPESVVETTAIRAIAVVMEDYQEQMDRAGRLTEWHWPYVYFSKDYIVVGLSSPWFRHIGGGVKYWLKPDTLEIVRKEYYR